MARALPDNVTGKIISSGISILVGAAKTAITMVPDKV